jgi:hypothetical protein
LRRYPEVESIQIFARFTLRSDCIEDPIAIDVADVQAERAVGDDGKRGIHERKVARAVVFEDALIVRQGSNDRIEITIAVHIDALNFVVVRAGVTRHALCRLVLEDALAIVDEKLFTQIRCAIVEPQVEVSIAIDVACVGTIHVRPRLVR